MSPLISTELAEEAVKILLRMNRGYWESLSWELQSDGTEFVVIVSLTEAQNTRENILAACAILRTVMATLLPSSSQGLTWVGSVMFQGKDVGGVCGGLGDDWRTLGTHGGTTADEFWEEEK
ncbi:MAG: hypothetical protein ABL970_11575 [Nitrospira sp.]